MRPIPIDRLVLKGTHNSYSCDKGIPLDQQLDDFGVWAIELDFGIKNLGGQFRAIVGHSDAGDNSVLVTTSRIRL